MAYDISTSANYSGRPAFNLYLYVRRDQTDAANNRSSYAWELRARNPNGLNQTYALDCWGWAVNVGGQGFNGCHSLDFRGGQAYIVLGTGSTGWFYHDSNGNLTVQAAASHSTNSVFGSANTPMVYLQADRIAQIPYAPNAPVASNITPTSMTLSWNIPDNRGAAIDQMLLRRFPTSDTSATNYFDYPNAGNVTSRTVTDLVPGTNYWWVVYAHNAVGYSPASPSTKATTLPTVPPGISVTPSLTGTSASIALTPPAGSTPDSYRVERRVLGGADVVTYNTSTSPLVVSSLTPGTSYEWRASAFVGAYQTPWSDWVAALQPNPNTNPGDYFDGSTPDKTDTTYSWTGTENNSVSVATAKSPLGWGNFASGSSDSGGTGTVIRVSGGRSGNFSARVTFGSSTTSSGFHAGLDYVDGVAITSNGTQSDALIYVQLPGRTQRLAAMLVWVDEDGIEVGRTIGDGVQVPSSSVSWTALRVSGAAPLGTEGVALRVIDVEGPGWSLWIAGDILNVDDAITPFDGYYFDGDTSDTDQYTYSWEGTPNDSPSIRVKNDVPVPDPLLDPDCPPVPTPPRPPSINDSCAETDVTEWRRMVTTIGEQGANPEWLDIIPTLSLTTTADVRLVRIRYYQNPFSRPISDLDMADYCAEQIVTFIPTGAILTLDGISERVWAEVAGSSATLAADHLLATQQGDVPQWPLLGCGVAYYVTIDTPIEIPAGTMDANYYLTARYR